VYFQRRNVKPGDGGKKVYRVCAGWIGTPSGKRVSQQLVVSKETKSPQLGVALGEDERGGE